MEASLWKHGAYNSGFYGAFTEGTHSITEIFKTEQEMDDLYSRKNSSEGPRGLLYNSRNKVNDLRGKTTCPLSTYKTKSFFFFQFTISLKHKWFNKAAYRIKKQTNKINSSLRKKNKTFTIFFAND